MTTHTPGPWRLCAYGVGYGYRIYESNGAGPGIAEISDKRRDHHANARLIAAAPNLLRECQREVDWLEHIKPQIAAHASVMIGFEQALKYLRAAIAEATGEQS